ncbi:hypothetical protein [Sphingomonas japonica]|uniref:Uncharacterized protein n=1 Tax=Sphingomonas japonica TaxID=511662 RepID=A0ABX0U2B5_9SPHN|nr:hypothetical protein [Sphingomonas japonica]NIJ23841.1 hypothetical protein [Sphingomonas japonica]
MRAVDWIGRVALLVLSGLATMALLTSIASVSDQAFESAIQPPGAVERAEYPPDTPVAEPSEGRLVGAGPAPASRDDRLAAKLDALIYAILALAGFAAAILLVLLRMTVHLSRIASR